MRIVCGIVAENIINQTHSLILGPQIPLSKRCWPNIFSTLPGTEKETARFKRKEQEKGCFPNARGNRLPVPCLVLSSLNKVAFINEAKYTLGKNVQHGTFRSVTDLVVETASAEALPCDSVRTVSYISDQSKTFQFYLDGFFINFVVRLFNEFNGHARLEELLTIMIFCSCDCKENSVHDK